MESPSPITDKASELAEKATDAVEETAHQLHQKMLEAKPKLRGWLHAATSPLAIAAGIVLITLSPTAATKASSALFAGTAILLFTVSAIYHRGNWSPRTWAFLKTFDHANIFLLIAGSYTPFVVALLDGNARIAMLVIVWVGAIAGVAMKLLWKGAPRWLSAPIYIALGWASIFYVDDFAHGGGPAVVTLIIVGGGLYTLGGVVYALKKPDPFPKWFGFHEIFHVFTIAAFVCHYVAASIVTYQLR